MTTNASTKGGVFISYSHKDAHWLKRLQTMMSPLVRSKTISVWWDGRIKPSQRWRDEIDKALSSSSVGVLLVSPDFLESGFIDREELAYLLNAAEQRSVRLTWVFLRPCLYDKTPIAQYQAAHDIARPLNSLRQARLDAALVQICRAIECLMGGVPAADDPKPWLPSPAIAKVVTGRDSLLQETKAVQKGNPQRLRILVLCGSWDEKWKKTLSKHLDIPDQLGILKWHRVPLVKVYPSWISEFKRLAGRCSAIVCLVSPKLIDSLQNAELDTFTEETANTKRLTILPLMTNPRSGVRLPAWLPAVAKDNRPEQAQEQSGQYREQLRQHAICANTATQLGNLLENDSICESMSNAEMVRLYRWRTRESMTCPTDGGRGAGLIHWAALATKGPVYGGPEYTTETLHGRVQAAGRQAHR